MMSNINTIMFESIFGEMTILHHISKVRGGSLNSTIGYFRL